MVNSEGTYKSKFSEWHLYKSLRKDDVPALQAAAAAAQQKSGPVQKAKRPYTVRGQELTPTKLRRFLKRHRALPASSSITITVPSQPIEAVLRAVNVSLENSLHAGVRFDRAELLHGGISPADSWVPMVRLLSDIVDGSSKNSPKQLTEEKVSLLLRRAWLSVDSMIRSNRPLKWALLLSACGRLCEMGKWDWVERLLEHVQDMSKLFFDPKNDSENAQLVLASRMTDLKADDLANLVGPLWASLENFIRERSDENVPADILFDFYHAFAYYMSGKADSRRLPEQVWRSMKCLSEPSPPDRILQDSSSVLGLSVLLSRTNEFEKAAQLLRTKLDELRLMSHDPDDDSLSHMALLECQLGSIRFWQGDHLADAVMHLSSAVATHDNLMAKHGSGLFSEDRLHRLLNRLNDICVKLGNSGSSWAVRLEKLELKMQQELAQLEYNPLVFEFNPRHRSLSDSSIILVPTPSVHSHPHSSPFSAWSSTQNPEQQPAGLPSPTA